jgi:two-component system chemotaxis response regulator CheB
MPVIEPDDKQGLHPGTVYLAPPDYHLLVDGRTLSLSVDEPVNFARPSIDVLFESAAESEFRTVVGVLLTASSDDGANGISAIARAGGITIVQDPQDAESPTAALAALDRCRVDHVLPVSEIANKLVEVFRSLDMSR